MSLIQGLRLGRPEGAAGAELSGVSKHEAGMMKRIVAVLLGTLALAPVPALAQGSKAAGAAQKPAPAKTAKKEAAATKAGKRARPMRRAERHSREQTRVHRLTPVKVFGRQQRPNAVIDLSRARHKFSVGTARYSPRDRAFRKGERRRRVVVAPDRRR